jgi:glycosyltransferase involved in cell wall biosynthesis
VPAHQNALLSIVIPAHNAERTLPACLEAIEQSAGASSEVIVVDDRSIDRTVELARGRCSRIVSSRGPGPAAARNTGARIARGDVIVFLDADVTVHADTLQRLAATLDDAPDLAAVFGSYDDAPAAPNFLSQFKNLMHHFVHQNSPPEAMTFWAGCGAIRRSAFDAVGGFSASRFAHASVEDIELGFRLWREGYRVRLDPSIQVKHLKRWGFFSLLHTDLFRRAIPWSRLILETRVLPDQLNLKGTARLSAVLLLFFLAAVALLVIGDGEGMPVIVAAGLASWTLALVINRPFYAFLQRKKGGVFAARAVFWHQLYYVYGVLAFGCCWVWHQLCRTTAPS